MLKSVLLVFFVITIGVFWYVIRNVPHETIVPPTITIVVEKEEYSILGNRSKNILKLVESAQEHEKAGSTIVLYADKTISYERVKTTMSTLEEAGFNSVSLSATR